MTNYDVLSAMFPSVPQPRFLPCPECGETIAAEERGAHVCEEERWATFQLHQLREEVERLDAQVAAYLDSPQGRFASWDAARRRGQRG